MRGSMLGRGHAGARRGRSGLRLPGPGRALAACGLVAAAAAAVVACPGRARGGETRMATVVKSDGTTVELNVGRRHGVAAGSRFRICTLGKVVRIPLTGTVTYSEGQPIGTVRVIEAADDTSRCIVESLDPGRRIVAGFDAVKVSQPATSSFAGPSTAGPTALGTASAPAPTPSGLGRGPSLPSPTGLRISADPANPAPGQTVKIAVLGLGNVAPGYRVKWSSSRGSFATEETPNASVNWIAPRGVGRHEIRAAVVLPDGRMLDGRGLINVRGEVALSDKFELEKVMGYYAFAGGKQLTVLDVAFDEKGNAYFLDAKMKCIYRLERGASINAFASRETCAEAGLRSPLALAVRRGLAYVLDESPPHVKVFAEGDRLERTMGEKRAMGSPQDLAVDMRGLTYVLDRGQRCFHIFDASGSYLHERGARGKKELGQFEMPVAIDVGPGGNIYVLDRARMDVQAFSPTYSVFSKIGVKVRRGNQLADIAVASDGKSIFVLEGPQGLIARYGVDGRVMCYPEKDPAMFPDLPAKATRIASDGLGKLYVIPRARTGVYRYTSRGRSSGRFAADPPGKALGIAVDDAGRFAVLDQKSPHVRLYDPDGWAVARFGQTTDIPVPYRLPKRIAMSRRGALVVTLGQKSMSAFDVATEAHALHIFDGRGNRVRSAGSRGRKPGQFKAPEDIDTDRAGSVYVLDRDLFRVSVFSEKGAGATPEREQALNRGSRLPHEMANPMRIAVDPETGHLYVYDQKSRLIKKFNKGGVYIATTEPDLGFKEVDRMRVDHLGLLWVFERKRQSLRRIDFRTNTPKESLSLELRELVAGASIDFGLDGSGRVYVLTAKDLVYVYR